MSAEALGLDYQASADAWWEPARQRALADVWRQVKNMYYLHGDKAVEESLAEQWPDWAAAERDQIMSPDWVPERGRRMVVSYWRIARHWSELGTFGEPGSWPFCFGCLRPVPCTPGTPDIRWNSATRYLQRAHLVDHCRDGLDGPQNLVPLCRSCHRAMPSFGPGEGPDAIAWVSGGSGRRLCFVYPGWGAQPYFEPAADQTRRFERI